MTENTDYTKNSSDTGDTGDLNAAETPPDVSVVGTADLNTAEIPADSSVVENADLNTGETSADSVNRQTADINTRIPISQMPEFQHMPRLSIGQIKELALSKLKSKWQPALISMSIYILLFAIPTTVCSILTNSKLGLLNPAIVSLLTTVNFFFNLILSGAFSISIAALSLSILRDEEFSPDIIFTGFKRFGQSFAAHLLKTVFSLLWAVLLLIPGFFIFAVGLASSEAYSIVFICTSIFIFSLLFAFIFLYRYGLTFFIAADNRELPAKVAISYSISILRDVILEYFALQVSFIGWGLLLIFPFILSSTTIYIAYDQSSMLLGVIGIALGMVAFFFMGVLILYMKVSSAIFYSLHSDNYRIVDPFEEYYNTNADTYVSEHPGADVQV